MKQKKKIGLLYLYMAKKIEENLLRIDRTISKREAINFLHCWQIPKSYRAAIIKEMENLGLFKTLRFNTLIVITKPRLPKSNLINKVVGIW